MKPQTLEQKITPTNNPETLENTEKTL